VGRKYVGRQEKGRTVRHRTTEVEKSAGGGSETGQRGKSKSTRTKRKRKRKRTRKRNGRNGHRDRFQSVAVVPG
jgi:hypothetical protein